MMFDLNIRFQIAAIAVLLIVLVDFIKTPHLKLLSTKFFLATICATVFNLAADIFSVYTITHMDALPEWVNRFAHQLFIGSVILAVFMNFLYVLMLGKDQKRLPVLQKVLIAIPLLVSLGGIIFADIGYYAGGTTVYSFGPMVYLVYACATLFLLLTLLISFDKKMHFLPAQRISIRVGLIIWAIALCVQMTFPRFLLSGIGFVLLVLAIYFSFENPRETLDSEMGCFNKNAFHRVMAEYYEGNKSLFLINIVCENYGRINTVLGHEKGTEAMKYIHQLMKKYLNDEIYHSRSNVLSTLVQVDVTEPYRMEYIERLEYALLHNEFKESKLKCHIDIMDLKKYAPTRDDVYELLNFMSSESRYGEHLIYFLDDEIQARKNRYDRIEKLLIDAIRNDGFEMYYQPIFWPKTGEFKSAEALIRMKKDSEIGYVSPEEFIPIAEEKGMIMEIGESVMRMVARCIRRNQLQYTSLSYIEVNLSGIQAIAPDIDKSLTRILKSAHVNPEFINLEITETAMLGSGRAFQENISKLRTKGFSFSMDDFGTGYSNLAQMNDTPYDLVKIDKSLIWPAFGENSSEKARNLLDSVIDMLEQMNLKIVAEGVETKEMVDYLSAKGVDHLQGYYFSKPISEQDYVDNFVK